MSTEDTSYRENAADTASEVNDRISDAASRAKGAASDLGRTASDKVDRNRDAAAKGIDSAASALHQRADNLPGGEKVTNLAHSTADKLNATADYVRDHDVKSMMTDVETLVKNNPGPSLLAAAVVGFLVGRSLSSRD